MDDKDVVVITGSSGFVGRALINKLAGRFSRSVAVSALVITTGEDAVHPVDFARTLAATIPGATLVEITSMSVDRVRYVAEFKWRSPPFSSG
jgi:uncharacterized protein YbjT (DUF2867 family)